MVSAIIPCHNYGLYVDFAVDSLLSQTYKDIEILLVDDGSTDGFTITKLGNYMKPKTRVIRREQGWPAAARNTGFEHSKGDYILILDADDLLESTFVEKALKIMEEKKEVGVVSSYVLNFGYKEAVWRPTGGKVESFLYDINCGSAGLIRREAWIQSGGFNEAFIEGYEDWNFWIDVTKRGWFIHIIPELLFFYRTKEHSRVKDTAKLHREIYDKIKRIHPECFDSGE